MKALAYQADPSSVPVGPPHRVSPAKASKKVINVETSIIKVIHPKEGFQKKISGARFTNLDFHLVV